VRCLRILDTLDSKHAYRSGSNEPFSEQVLALLYEIKNEEQRQHDEKVKAMEKSQNIHAKRQRLTKSFMAKKGNLPGFLGNKRSEESEHTRLPTEFDDGDGGRPTGVWGQPIDVAPLDLCHSRVWVWLGTP
jgi:hypothetical protein